MQSFEVFKSHRWKLSTYLCSSKTGFCYKYEEKKVDEEQRRKQEEQRKIEETRNQPNWQQEPPETCIDYFEGECIKACSDDKTCAKGKYCHYDEKVCLDPCKAQEECVEGYKCSFSQGMKRCVKKCECNSECDSGQYCK